MDVSREDIPPPPSTPTSGSTISVSSSASTTPNSRRDIVIPDHWRPEVEACLKEKCLTSGARNEIVRSLVNQLFTRASKPTRVQCEELARKLILKYPFVKDDMGTGYVSVFQLCTIALSTDNIGIDVGPSIINV